jgi:hypothetical protein
MRLATMIMLALLCVGVAPKAYAANEKDRALFACLTEQAKSMPHSSYRQWIDGLNAASEPLNYLTKFMAPCRRQFKAYADACLAEGNDHKDCTSAAILGAMLVVSYHYCHDQREAYACERVQKALEDQQ